MNIRRALLLVIGFSVALAPTWADSPKKLRGDRKPGSVRALDLARRPADATQTITPAATRGGSQDIYVSTTGNNVTADGSVGLPFATIQAALFAALDGDRVRVLPGTYNECIDTTSATLGSTKNIEIVADDWIVSGLRTTTIIDGTGQCASPFSVVNLAGGAGTATTTRLEGFTVTGGSASGVFALGSVAVTNNIINNNTSTFGGGVYVYPGTCFYGPTTTTVSDNQVTNNTANSQGLCNPGNTPCNTSANCPNVGATCDILGGDGGGIYVFGASVNSGGTIGCLGGDSTVTVEDNLVDGNFADNAFGGGLYVLTNTQSLRTADVAVTSNVISNNQTLPLSAGYGGGAWMSTYGYGTETIDFVDNTVTNNTSTGDGGGVSAWIDSLNDAVHQINVTDNNIQLNNAEGAGGGMDLFVFGRDIGASDSIELNAVNNTVLSNSSQGSSTTSLYPGLGGGIIANVWSQRGLTAIDLNVTENDVRGNSATIGGGGVAVIATSDADPDLNGSTGQAIASARVANNLVGVNDALDGGAGAAVGGGIFAYLEAFGEALSTIDLSLNTVDTNNADTGSGGIEIENHTLFDTNLAMEGEVQLSIDNSIISFNSGFGVGGPGAGIAGTLTPGNGTANFTRTFDYNAFSSNASGDYEAAFTPGANNDIFADPLLDNNFRPSSCSPTIDAADPIIGFANEPAPNGGQANLGHTGGLSIAVQSLADGNGDGAVDGLDIVKLSAAFNSFDGFDARFDASVDFNNDGLIDGVDLALMAANYAVSCP